MSEIILIPSSALPVEESSIAKELQRENIPFTVLNENNIEALRSSIRGLKHPPKYNTGKKLISVVIPIYFEELLIDELNKRLHQAMKPLCKNFDYELIFVNDGSKDSSLAQLIEIQKQDHRVRVIDLSRNFGHQIAITSGIDHAQGDAVVVIDGDLQDPPEVIPKMVEKWQEGYHVVYGVREKRPGETAFKLLTAKIFYRLLSWFSSIDMPVDAGDFRLMDRKVVQSLTNMREDARYIRGMVSWIGFKQFGLKYKRDQRYAGETKYTLLKMLRFAADGVTSFSERPLYLSGFLGFLICIISGLMAMRILFAYLSGDSTLIQGWTSTILAVFFFGGVQLLFLGVIGQYIGRIYRESKDRPLYFISNIYEQAHLHSRDAEENRPSQLL